MRQIVLITGRLFTGKSGLANLLRDEFGYHVIRTRCLLEEEASRRSRPTDRASLHQLIQELDRETDSRWIVEHVASCLVPPMIPIIVDNVFTKAQLERFRMCVDSDIVHVHLYANGQELQKRFESNKSNLGEEAGEGYSALDHLKDEGDLKLIMHDADVRINTARTDARDCLVRVAARLKLYSPPDVRCVDVIVGGQYGSEGKGHVAAYLATEYDVLVRVGGPNAGHTVSSASGVYTYHQLPSGAKDTNAKLLLGPGMTIHVPSLLKEIEDCGITPERLFIDPQAMIVGDEDKEVEKELVGDIASTGSGSGAAQARRILQRGKDQVKLARNIPELSPYVGSEPDYRGSTIKQLESAYRDHLSILLEGTQGSGLSLFHGYYPYVTSRDTNVAGCLAEAGISPSRVRRILMVIRTTPIRVGNPDGTGGKISGPLKHEVTFEKIAETAGLNPEELLGNEKTSTTKRSRRVGWFEWEQFRRACSLNAPTDIVLTFADYIKAENRSARRFEQLTEDTIKFVEELERVAQAPVSLINTRFPRGDNEKIDLRTVIDRRNWTVLQRR